MSAARFRTRGYCIALSLFVLILSCNLSTTLAEEPVVLPFIEEQVYKEKKRRLLIAQNLPLTDEEEEKFWPLYDSYRAILGEKHRKGNQVATRISKTFGLIPNDYANTMLNEVLSVEASAHQLRYEHLQAIQSVLPGRKSLRYFQLDMRLEALFLNDLTNRIEFISVTQ